MIFKTPTYHQSSFWHVEVEPGGSTDIEMICMLRGIGPYFAKMSAYRTNDPTQNEFILKVQGEVVVGERILPMVPR